MEVENELMQQKGAPMTISSSLSAGVAGLNANATRLATISDNIAFMVLFGGYFFRTSVIVIVCSASTVTTIVSSSFM